MKKVKAENILHTTGMEWIPSKTKQPKIRLLPDVFYLRWELELFSAFVLIPVLMMAPGWAGITTNSLLPGGDNELMIQWISVFCQVMIAALTVYVLLRFLWLYLFATRKNAAPARIYFTKQTDQVAEFLISVCILLLVVSFFAFMLYLLIGYIQSGMPDKIRIKTPFKMET